MGSPDAIPVTHIEHALNVNSAHLIERERAPAFFGSCEAAMGLADMLGKVGNINEIGAGRNRGAGDDVRR